MKNNKGKTFTFLTLSHVIIVMLLLFSFVPMLTSIFMSLKTSTQIRGDFWSLPNPIAWSNYSSALLSLLGNMGNTVVVVLLTAFGVIALSCLSGYVFAQLDFPFKNVLFMAILAVMMVPAVVTLTPLYSLVVGLGLKDSWLALLLPYFAGGQVMGVLLCRTFIAAQPKALYEAARIDGSSELRNFVSIAVPLARPILVTLGVLNAIATYNDYVWPLLVISTQKKQLLMVSVTLLVSEYGATEVGIQTAGYVFSSLPLLLLFMFGMKYYVSGMTSGAVKA